jgi:DNA repair photolyase
MNTPIYEITCEKLLVPSRITLGEYVINPYRGCALGCLYCYAKKTKFAQKRKQAWGTFVDAKTNVADVLNAELDKVKKPVRHVLIGSLTESYQPAERVYHSTRTILRILNERAISYTILTRSPLLMEDLDIIKQNSGAEIYVTVTPLVEPLRQLLEPHAVSFNERKEFVAALSRANVKVNVYVNPVFPYCYDLESLMKEFKGITPYVSFESINVQMIDWNVLKGFFNKAYQQEFEKINKAFTNQDIWNDYWQQVAANLETVNTRYGYTLRTFFHSFSSFFEGVSY